MYYEDKGNKIFGGRGFRLDFPHHIHNAVEIAWMQKGSATLKIGDKVYAITSGDVFMVFPNQVHSYISFDREEYLLYVIPEAILKPYKKWLYNFASEKPIIKICEESKLYFNNIEKEILSPNKFSENMICAYAQALLGISLKKLTLTEQSTARSRLNKIISFCIDNVSRELSLEVLSKELFLSKSHISHLFSNHLGITFTQYINTLRINEATHLLDSTDKKISDIAFSCGFSDIRTFNRVFKKVTLLSPREYRNKI